mmetsp:Transcript_28742/g.43405  ORF Transcript_28742/g.43405 Transcript_28742/m.43405 type:complete len:109 (+) Transcript_28742:962-1288(+)
MCLTQVELPHHRLDKTLVALKQDICQRKRIEYKGEDFKIDSGSDSDTDSNDISARLMKTYMSIMKTNPKMAHSVGGTQSPFQQSKAGTPFHSQPLGVIDEQLSHSPRS